MGKGTRRGRGFRGRGRILLRGESGRCLECGFDSNNYLLLKLTPFPFPSPFQPRRLQHNNLPPPDQGPPQRQHPPHQVRPPRPHRLRLPPPIQPRCGRWNRLRVRPVQAHSGDGRAPRGAELEALFEVQGALRSDVHGAQEAPEQTRSAHSYAR